MLAVTSDMIAVTEKLNLIIRGTRIEMLLDHRWKK